MQLVRKPQNKVCMCVCVCERERKRERGRERWDQENGEGEIENMRKVTTVWQAVIDQERRNGLRNSKIEKEEELCRLDVFEGHRYILKQRWGNYVNENSHNCNCNCLCPVSLKTERNKYTSLRMQEMITYQCKSITWGFEKVKPLSSTCHFSASFAEHFQVSSL